MFFAENTNDYSEPQSAEMFALSPDATILNEFQEGMEVAKYFSWEFERLTGHITGVYHSYIRAVLPRLRELLSDLKGSAEFENARESFFESISDWAFLLEFETNALFPYIKELRRIQVEGLVPKSRSERLSRDISWINRSNTEFKKIMAAITTAMQGSFSSGSTESIAEIHDLLGRFRRQCSTLLFIEDSILFPRALRLERELAESQE